jgi:methylthioribose-1-phosphate isomerase
MEPLLMDIENTVYLEGDCLIVVDRRELPLRIARIRCADYGEVAQAIERMAVQGAGDIAVAAGYGLYLASRSLELSPGKAESLAVAAERLSLTRPTGHYLAALLKKLLGGTEGSSRPSEIILNSMKKIIERQRTISRETGRHAQDLLSSGDRILTHCFAGAGLLYMLRFAKEAGKDVRVVCAETRPYLQGARLTAWSVSELGMDTTLITDNMAAHFMSRGEIDKVFTAADRIAMDGTVANKIGTLQLAICAAHYGLPFYVLGYGDRDPNTARGEDIPIEERDPAEVTRFKGEPITSPLVRGRYPAFDLTPPELVTAVVTWRGVHNPKDFSPLCQAF